MRELRIVQCLGLSLLGCTSASLFAPTESCDPKSDGASCQCTDPNDPTTCRKQVASTYSHFETCQQFQSGDMSDVICPQDGELMLRVRYTPFETPYLWVPNSGENTVSLIDTAAATNKFPKPMPLIDPKTNEPCYNPSRTTVDENFDVWVGCRGFNSYCDGNPGAVITDIDNKIMKVSKDDGRVIMSLRVGNAPRALALDSSNHLWVGNSVDATVWEVDGSSGHCYRGSGTGFDGAPCDQAAISVPKFPYGAQVDADGYLWLVNRQQSPGGSAPICNTGTGMLDVVSRIDIRPGVPTNGKVQVFGPFSRSGCTDLYGMAVDLLGQLWVGGYSCGDLLKICANDTGCPYYDGSGKPPATLGTLMGVTQIVPANGNGGVRGVSVDAKLYAWAVVNGVTSGTSTTATASGEVAKIDSATGIPYWNTSVGVGVNLPAGAQLYGNCTLDATTAFQPPATGNTDREGPVGISTDALGNAWVVDMLTDTVTKISTVDQSKTVIPVGDCPYTYSDMMGLLLRLVTLHKNATGIWRVIVNSGASGTKYSALDWTATVPAGTSLGVQYRCSDDATKLGTQSTIPLVPASPMTAPGPISCTGQYLEAQVQFSATGTSTASPVLSAFTAKWN